jgi:hypothetical protein
MPTPKRHVLLLEFLMPLPIERWNIKNFVPLPITNLEHLLHLEDVDFESKINNRHGYHLAQGNSHLSFVFQHHLMLIKDFKVVKLGLVLNGLNSPIKGQGICMWQHLGSLQKNSNC